MKRTLFHRAIGAFLLISTFSAAAEPMVPSQTGISTIPVARADTQQRLKQYRDEQVRSVRTGNAAALGAYYADNVRLMPEYQKTTMGRQQALDYHAAFAARFEVREYRREQTETLDLGGQVLEIGSFALTLVRRAGGETRQLIGKYLELWRQAPSGEIALVMSGWNYNHAIEFADELRFAEVPAVQTALQPHLLVRDRISFELAAYNRLLESTVAQGDAIVWSQYYVEDAVLLPSFNPPVVGHAAISAFLQEHTKHLPVFEHLDIRNDRIDDLGAYVIEYASHIANWRNGESSGVNTGKDIRVWRREPDHSLRMIRSMGMYD